MTEGKPAKPGASRLLLLLGTDHKYQRADAKISAAGHAQFRSLLLSACPEHGVRAIAEEMSRKALADAGRKASVPELIARRLRLRHRCCDPNWRERVRLGIVDVRSASFFGGWGPSRTAREQRLSNRLREAEWLRRLEQLDTWPTLFICGANHVRGFAAQARAAGIDVEVLAKDWASTEPADPPR